MEEIAFAKDQLPFHDYIVVEMEEKKENLLGKTFHPVIYTLVELV